MDLLRIAMQQPELGVANNFFFHLLQALGCAGLPPGDATQMSGELAGFSKPGTMDLLRIATQHSELGGC